jgi:cytochrome c oxidase subunit 4
LLSRQNTRCSTRHIPPPQKNFQNKQKMQALRLARLSAIRPVAVRRCLTTATANHAEVASSSSSAPPITSSRFTPVPLSNLEALWTKLNSDEKLAVHEQLEALQLKDWKTLSMDEKKAG